MTIAPVRPRQAIQPAGSQGAAEYIPDVPSAGELGLAAHVRTPFVSSHLLNAQMERSAGIRANNQAAQQYMEQQAAGAQAAAQTEQMKAMLQYGMGENSPYKEHFAKLLGVDPGMIQQQAAEEAQARQAEQVSTVGTAAHPAAQAGINIKDYLAAAGVPEMGVGEMPAVSMNDADNRALIEQQKIAAAASMYGADQGLRGAQAGAADQGGIEFSGGIPADIASNIGPRTYKTKNPALAAQAEEDFARRYGSQAPGERPVAPATANSDDAQINDWAARNNVEIIGVPVTRPDGKQVVKVRDKTTGVVDEEVINRRQ